MDFNLCKPLPQISKASLSGYSLDQLIDCPANRLTPFPSHLEMQLSGCKDDVLSSLLNERLNAGVGLVEESQAFNELWQFG